jgi:ribonucleoside-diphosphate reductase alpha chain
LRKNTGDERRRTHDMNTANWVPDLFMQRVEADGDWTLFSPNETPDLHDLYGKAFAERYAFYEAKAARGEMRSFKHVRASDLRRRMLTMLFETGHPWITFKDACNLRSPQQHAGVIHSSNLCTEITLNTSDDEVAVCNLGSVNLLNHIAGGKLDIARLKRTVTTAMRMLDTSSTSTSTPSRKRAARTSSIVP